MGSRVSAEVESMRLGVDRGIPDLHLTIYDADGKKIVAADDSHCSCKRPGAVHRGEERRRVLHRSAAQHVQRRERRLPADKSARSRGLPPSTRRAVRRTRH